MKKLLSNFLIVLLFFIISSLVVYFLQYITFNNKFIPLIIGSCNLTLNIINGILGKKHFCFNILTLILSSISLGFILESYWIYKELEISLIMLLLNSLLASLTIIIFYFISFIPIIDKKPVLFFIIYFIISLLGIIILIIVPELKNFSILGFYIILTIAFIIVNLIDFNSYKEWFRGISLASFSVIIVGFIVLIIILDGDISAFDLPLNASDFSTSNYRKNINKI